MATKKRESKMGRPLLNADLKRTKRISVVVNDKEYKAIKTAAAGIPASIWLRDLVLRALADASTEKKK